MVSREDFLAIPRMAKEIADEENRIAVMRSKLYSPKGLDTSEKVQSSGSQSHLADIVIDMEQALEEKKRELDWLKTEALTLVDETEELSGEERAIMVLRYEEDRTWPEITETIHYAVATVFRMHRTALDKIFKG